MSAAALGDPSFVSGFRLVGVEGIVTMTDEDAVQVLHDLLKEDKYKIIILPERLVKPTRELRSIIMREGKVSPIFAFIPDYTGIKGERIEELKRSISLAVGAELQL